MLNDPRLERLVQCATHHFETGQELNQDQKFRAQIAATIYAGMVKDVIENINRPGMTHATMESEVSAAIRSSVRSADAIIDRVKETSP